MVYFVFSKISIKVSFTHKTLIIYSPIQVQPLEVQGPNAVLCKTCPVQCILEQLRLDNSSVGLLKHGAQLV
jgi:hypothetical protein